MQLPQGEVEKTIFIVCSKAVIRLSYYKRDDTPWQVGSDRVSDTQGRVATDSPAYFRRDGVIGLEISRTNWRSPARDNIYDTATRRLDRLCQTDTGKQRKSSLKAAIRLMWVHIYITYVNEIIGNQGDTPATLIVPGP